MKTSHDWNAIVEDAKQIVREQAHDGVLSGISNDILTSHTFQSPLPVEAWKKIRSLDRFDHTINTCQKCPLGATRTNFVFGSGNPQAEVMFIGEAPGRDEDLQGKPFVGRAGALLTKIIESVDFKREDVYITNILKCRPPQNRDPLPEEIDSCRPYLFHQIELIKPRVICTLGRFAAQLLLTTKESMMRVRGKVHSFRGRKLIATFHPAALLRNPDWKRLTWEDIQLVRKIYDEGRKGHGRNT